MDPFMLHFPVRLLSTLKDLHLHKTQMALLPLRFLLCCEYCGIELPLDLAQFAISLYHCVLCGSWSSGLECHYLEEQFGLSLNRKGHIDIHSPLSSIRLYNDSTLHAKRCLTAKVPRHARQSQWLDGIRLQFGLLRSMAMGLLHLHWDPQEQEDCFGREDQFVQHLESR